MKYLSCVLLATILLFSLQKKIYAQEKPQDWGNAKWIALEHIPDSLKLVPGLHSLGSKFKNSYKRRSKNRRSY